MILPTGFKFSQSSLQDFEECRRRFQLRYLERRAWPAIETEPALEFERWMRQGQRFHQMVQQHLSGVPLAQLANQNLDPDLSRWWDQYQQACQDPALLGGLWQPGVQRQPEITLGAPLGEFRLTAKYDLVAKLTNGQFLIYDWKTSRHQPRRNWLERRLQTRVYPFLLTQAGQVLNQGNPISADQIEMIYWFADYPSQPIHFQYSQNQAREDQHQLTDTVKLILKLEENEFPLTSDQQRCRYCVYRSLCDRGTQAGTWDASASTIDTGEGSDFEIDFEQIAEIEF